jgi:hypothetical protein
MAASKLTTSYYKEANYNYNTPIYSVVAATSEAAESIKA